MRTINVLLKVLFLLPMYGMSQNDDPENKLIDYSTKVYLETKVDFATSTEDTRSDAQAGYGTLGLKYERKLLYGGVRFTVFSRNDSIQAESSSDKKIFGSNLLIPSNSSNSISNFTFYIGAKSFQKLDSIKADRDLLSWSRFGTYLEYSINNTTWNVSELAIPVNISSTLINLSYRLLTLEFEESENGRAILSLNFGYTNRRLGGDYGLDSNKDNRDLFIGTEKLNFGGYNMGVRLEVSNFFGQFNFTRFKDENIPGFSGAQAVINVGFRANLNLKAKENPQAL